MNKDELFELAENGDFISGIYNYCDRWCERCPFTSRCLVYATERQDEMLADPETHDIDNAKFWQRLESVFREAQEMIQAWAEEAGVDLEAADTEEARKAHDQEVEDARHHQLSRWARGYADRVEKWFQGEFAVEHSVHNDTTGEAESPEEGGPVSDAVEVVRWYQFFIAAKIFRALIGTERAEDELTGEDLLADLELDDELDEEEPYEQLIGADWSDSDGSAKIALIAIDRSMSAWRLLQSSLPEKAGTIMPMLVELEKLRSTTERTFPKARDFIRPGFDETISDSVS